MKKPPSLGRRCESVVRAVRGYRDATLPVVRNEAVADAGLRDDVPRPVRVGFELLAQAGDVNVEIVGFAAILRAPNVVYQHRVSEHPVRMRDEYLHQVVFRR